MKDDSIYLEHVAKALQKISDYIQNKTEKDFLEDSIIQDAVIRQFEIVGEATKRISKELKEKYPDVPWKWMSGMRDVLIHDYIDVDIFYGMENC
jgi:uncharacterized protein with HEPN domain